MGSEIIRRLADNSLAPDRPEAAARRGGLGMGSICPAAVGGVVVVGTG